MTLSGKTAIVTGAAAGIGLAIAARFAAAGAKVIGLDRNAQVQGLSERYKNLQGMVCDLGDAGQLASTLDRIFERYAPDILVNNAGINPTPGSILETPEVVWGEVFDTNVAALYRISKAVIPRMERGVIINIGSILGLVGARRNAAYAASKGAILALTRAMALDHAPDIRVNCICPGAIQTAMFEEYLNRCADPEAERRRIVSAIPMRRVGMPDDVALAALFLASDHAAWITGQTLVVDGGDSV